MISIFKFILFFIIIIGYLMIFDKKLKIKKDFLIPITFIILIIFLYFSSLLNMLRYATPLISIIGIGSYFYLIYKKELTFKYLKEFFDYKYILIFLIMIMVSIRCLSLKIIHYDNFSHWALIVKNLFVNNTLGSFEYNVDLFTSYPPGSALFIYYFGSVVSKTESCMLIGQAILNIGLLSSLTTLFQEKNKILSSITFVFSIMILLLFNNTLDNLLVDNMLGYVGILSLMIAYNYKNNLNKSFKLLTIVNIFLVILKNSGMFFVILNLLYLFFIGISKKEIKRSLKYIFISTSLTVLTYIFWKQHILMVYPNSTGAISKHSLSLDNFSKNLTSKGIDNIKIIIKLALKEFINIKSIILKYYLLINLFVISSSLILKNKIKNIIKILSLINGFYLVYFILVVAMYIFSMPINEALYLAGYDRYMSTMIIILFGFLFMMFFKSFKEKNLTKKNIVLVLFIILTSYIIYINQNNVLFKKQIVRSDPIVANQFTTRVTLDEYKNYNKIIYVNSPNLDYNKYIYRYYYLDTKIRIVNEEIDFNSIDNKTIVVITDEEYNNYILENISNIEKLKDNVYKIKES